MIPRPHLGRAAGIVLPLFSLRSAADWGIGEIGDLAPFGAWLRRAGFRALQLLPISTMPAGETSPYSALSAMAIDPVYISMPDVHDFRVLGGESRLPLADQVALRTARGVHACRRTPPCGRRRSRAPAGVQPLLGHRLGARHGTRGIVRGVLRRGKSGGWATTRSTARCAIATAACRGPTGRCRSDPDSRPRSTMRARALQREILFTSTCSGSPTSSGPMRARRSASQAVRRLALHGRHRQRRRLGEPAPVPLRSHRGHAARRLQRHRAGLGPARLPLGGDGARRSPLAATARAAKRRLYDGYRIDHLVGFFRTYSRPLGENSAASSPRRSRSDQRRANGSSSSFRRPERTSSPRTSGLIPDFVRDSLRRIGLPGYKVIRWEREWSQPGHPFVPPSQYPAVSVATTSTHDIEPMALWWEVASADEKRALAAILGGGQDAPDARPRGVAIHRGRPAAPAARGVRGGVEPAAPADAGCLWLARSHQRPRDGRRRQLVVAPAHRCGSDGGRPVAGLVRRHPARAGESERPSCLNPSAHRS